MVMSLASKPEVKKPSKATIAKALFAAQKAGEVAGDAWLAKHTKPAFVVLDGLQVVGKLLDLCALGSMQVYDGRHPLARYLKANGQNWKYFKLGSRLEWRQEYGLLSAYYEAAAASLRESLGAKVYAQVRVD